MALHPLYPGFCFPGSLVLLQRLERLALDAAVPEVSSNAIRYFEYIVALDGKEGYMCWTALPYSSEYRKICGTEG